MRHVKNLIVGCGFSGAVLARKLAEDSQEDVLIIDAKDHIAGNCYDYFDENGICVHKYGTHIFHTQNKEVWDFVSRFTEWNPYMHQVKGVIDGMEVPIPFNLNSIETVFPGFIAEKLEKKLVERFGYGVKVPILDLRRSKDDDLVFLAEYVYNKVFLGYTLKQWGLTPDELDPAVTGRVPVFISRDNRYFQDKYQGIPEEGYTKLVEKMLCNPRIEVLLSCKFSEIREQVSYDRLFYCGPIDEYFDYCFGQLPYRSLRFDFFSYDLDFYQDNSVVNYPENYDFTRIGEYKYFMKKKPLMKTVISKEYPQAFAEGVNERYYPVIREENLQLYKRYADLAVQQKNLYFLGRLGDYKYYDMDKAAARALDLWRSVS